MKTLYQLLLDRWNQNCDTVLVTIVEGNGSIPRTTGAYMAADQTGRIYGTIGGGNLEYQAVKKAMTLREAFLAKGISMYGSSMTNQQFPILTDAQKEALAKDFAFEYWGEAKEGKSIVRFCTSWATNDAQIKALTDAIAAL